MVLSWKPSTCMAEAGVLQVLGQPGLCKKILSQESKTWGCSSADHLPQIHRALCSIPKPMNEEEENNQGSSNGLVREGLCPQSRYPRLLATLPDEGRTHYNPAQPWSLWIPLWHNFETAEDTEQVKGTSHIDDRLPGLGLLPRSKLDDLLGCLEELGYPCPGALPARALSVKRRNQSAVEASRCAPYPAPSPWSFF